MNLELIAEYFGLAGDLDLDCNYNKKSDRYKPIAFFIIILLSDLPDFSDFRT